MREFIRHPISIPLEVKVSDQAEVESEYLNNVSLGGLSFHSRKRIAMGTRINIRIPLLGERIQVSGRVVWCHKQSSAYEVGVVFQDREEAFRTRMIEQICHIEEYKNEVWERERRQLTSEQAAAEWIKKYADTFPQMTDEKVS